jgi:hypothetical protein
MASSEQIRRTGFMVDASRIRGLTCGGCEYVFGYTLAHFRAAAHRVDDEEYLPTATRA